MTGKERIEEYVRRMEERYGDVKPIYRIFVFEKPDTELCGVNGKPLGLPDTGCGSNMGFYYELDTAIQAMNENWCDIKECAYHAGFVLCQYPGLYQSVCSDARIYYRWNGEGFFEAEEPEIFKYCAF